MGATRLAARRKQPLGRTFTRLRGTPGERRAASGRALVERRLERGPDDVEWRRDAGARGKYGESLVHVLLVQASDAHLALVAILVRLVPSVLADEFLSDRFRGVGCLHLAVSLQDELLLDYLLDAGGRRLVNEARASGTLFRSPLMAPAPRVSAGASGFWCDAASSRWPSADGSEHLILFDKLLAPRNADEDGGGDQAAPSYLGESPLAWAVSFNSRALFERLVRAGADQNARDAHLNTCLHLIVINNQRVSSGGGRRPAAGQRAATNRQLLQGWARFLTRASVSRSARNKDNLTALLLACRLGRARLFGELLELSAVEFWSYSMIRCAGYPLLGLDSVASAGQSALSTILESRAASEQQKSALLSAPVVKRLLEEKWKLFGFRLFVREILALLIHLSLFMAAVALRPSTMAPAQEAPRRLFTRLACEALTWLTSAAKLAALAAGFRRLRAQLVSARRLSRRISGQIYQGLSGKPIDAQAARKRLARRGSRSQRLRGY